MKTIAKRRVSEYPGHWLITDYTMEELEKALSLIQKIEEKASLLIGQIHDIPSCNYDREEEQSCSTCVYYDKPTAEDPKGTYGGCTYLNDWLHEDRGKNKKCPYYSKD